MIAIGNFFFRFRSFIFILMAGVLFIPSPPMSAQHRRAVMAAGLVIALAGQFIRLITIGYDYIIRGGRSRRVYAEGLVTGGVFAHCRNPMYLGNILMVLGVGLLANSSVFVLAIVPALMFIYQSIVMAEENFLYGKFGEDYLAYCADVKRWVPGFKGLSRTLKEQPFAWKRVVLKEHTTTFFLLSVILFVVAREVYINDADVFYTQLPAMITVAGILVLGYVTARILKKKKIWANQ
jgi:protein-S-isoprenylcysteine O-methyltransferase Ste14